MIRIIIGVLLMTFSLLNVFSAIFTDDSFFPSLTFNAFASRTFGESLKIILFYIVLVAFMYLFFLLIRSGVRAYAKKKETAWKGKEAIGIVAAIPDETAVTFASKVDVAVLTEDNKILHMKTRLGPGETYEVGDYLCVKYQDSDLHISRIAEFIEIPALTVRILEYYPKFFEKGYTGEYIIRGADIEDMPTVTIDDKGYNIHYIDDIDAREGFYRGESGAFYSGDSGAFYKEDDK